MYSILKMKGYTKSIMVYSTLLLVFYIISYAYTDVHEGAHKQIYKNWGISSTTVNNMNPIGMYKVITGQEHNSGYTFPSNNSNRSLCNDECELAHSMNEVVGYQLVVVISAMFFLMFVFFVYKLVTSNAFDDDPEESEINLNTSIVSINHG